MSRLPILEYPDPRLRVQAAPVAEFNRDLSRLVDDLFETMYASRAIGLAATQVNVPQRLLTIDVSEDQTDPQVFINPIVESRSRFGLVEESCLSLPGIVANVPRATALRVQARDREGNVIERELEGMLAVALQHEIDHLDGKLFVDRLSFFARLRLRSKLRRRSVAAADIQA